jgi:hypothetical protein
LEQHVKGGRNSVDFFDNRSPRIPVQVEQLRHMLFADYKGIAGKKLVAIEHRIATIEFGDPEFRFINPFCTHLARFHESPRLKIDFPNTSTAGPVM